MKALNGVTWTLCDDATPELRKASDYVTELRSGLATAPEAVCICLPCSTWLITGRWVWDLILMNRTTCRTGWRLQRRENRSDWLCWVE